MESLFSAVFGKELGPLIADYGWKGSALLVCAILFKYVALPWIANKVKLYFETKKKTTDLFSSQITEVATSLKSMDDGFRSYFSHSRENWTEAKRSITDMRETLDLLLDNSSNELDIDGVINMMTIYLSLTHHRMFAFYRMSKKNNHILQMPHIIYAKYEDRKEVFFTKLDSQSARYTHKTKNLLTFWGDGGVREYVDELMHDLYCFQLAQANGEYTLVKDGDLDEWGGRIISGIIGSIRLWGKTGKTWMEQGGRSLIPKLTIADSKKTIEMLVSETPTNPAKGENDGDEKTMVQIKDDLD